MPYNRVLQSFACADRAEHAFLWRFYLREAPAHAVSEIVQILFEVAFIYSEGRAEHIFHSIDFFLFTVRIAVIYYRQFSFLLFDDFLQERDFVENSAAVGKLQAVLFKQRVPFFNFIP
jgi:hypothetical protein